MQKSNDNEIVQYLGVKRIINYLEVQVGLTQTLHFQGCSVMSGAYGVGGGSKKTLRGSVWGSLNTYMPAYV